MSVIGETEVAGEAGQRPLSLGEPLECFPHPKLPGLHFVQEDSPGQIGQALASWYASPHP